MSNAPHKAADTVNVFGIVLIGIASALLLWATAVALQGYYLQSAGPIEDERASMELESTKRTINAQQIANLHRSEENVAYQGSAEACFRNPIEAAMLNVVADAEAGKATLVPAVGMHNTRMVAPIAGYPDPAGAAAPPPVIDPKAPKKVTITDTNIQIDDKIKFETGSATISPESISLVEEIAAVLLANPRIELIEIAGHTDNVGGAETNTKLSKSRADAVRDYLVNRGVGAERLEAQGYGPTKPIADYGTDEGKEANRRVEFVIIKQRAANDAPDAPDTPNTPREPTP